MIGMVDREFVNILCFAGFPWMYRCLDLNLSVWVCILNVWTCILGVWTCILRVWTCILGVSQLNMYIYTCRAEEYSRLE